MRRFLISAAFLVLAAAPALACPNCKESNSAAVADGSNNEALWWNRSIFLMLGVPYALVGFAGFYCWRHLRHSPTIEA
jgi:hypothetical protein